MQHTMLKYVSFDIVFQEIPGEVTLAINISGCQNHCKGCHSPWLWEDKGETLSNLSLELLLERYGFSATCVCFMGGDSSPKEIERLAEFVKQKNSSLKTAWYSGQEHLPNNFSLEHLDFIKLGQYIDELGGLTSPNTNQRFYAIKNGSLIDRSDQFYKS